MVITAVQGATVANDGSDSAEDTAAKICCGVGAPAGFSVIAAEILRVLAAIVTSGGSRGSE